MKIKIKKLHPNAKLPSYAHPGDAGADFFALESTSIEPNKRVAVRTGIAVEIPDGFVGLIWDKSGIAIREGVKTLGGVIDSGYRGEVMIGMANLSGKRFVFEKGHKIAQMLIQKVENVDFVEVADLEESARGDKGFGSTGK
jgi:dUTP pyrophosphatase